MHSARLPRALGLAAAFLLAAPLVHAQSGAASNPPPAASPSAPLLSFDAVSIRPNRTGAPAMIDRTTRDGYSVENMVLIAVISHAYGIRQDLISGGPGWIGSDHYDVIAKVAGDDLPAYRELRPADRDQMLQAVLAERFHLVAHTQVKPLPGFSLTLAKSGVKLQPAKPNERGGWGAGEGSIRATAIPISSLATLLSGIIRQTVTDDTGLTGRYTFSLQWAQERPLSAAPSSAGNSAPQASDPSGPALPTALEEQLGLKLTPTKLPTTTLVIDHIDRPTEN